jgi:hypothetical protein
MAIARACVTAFWPDATSGSFDASLATSILARSWSLGQQLNRMALEAFLAMRDAAWSDGVPLVILYGWRSLETAQTNAARAHNPEGVASYSSHTLGLAMDLQIGVTAGVGRVTSTQAFTETDTHDMPNVVRMYSSPVHKWLMLNAEDFGWYPWHHEPWHWEYNPPGLRERFHR